MKFFEILMKAQRKILFLLIFCFSLLFFITHLLWVEPRLGARPLTMSGGWGNLKQGSSSMFSKLESVREKLALVYFESANKIIGIDHKLSVCVLCAFLLRNYPPIENHYPLISFSYSEYISAKM